MMRFLTAVMICLILLPGPMYAQERELEETRGLLDAIREDLVELRFEKALAGIEALLADRGMTEAERAEALVLRAQAHVAFGDLDGAEQDYREILRLRPGYEPEATLTPEKAMVRYRKVRNELIGLLRVDLRPKDARLAVDGEEVTPDAVGLVPLLAGEHRLSAGHTGYDPIEQVVSIEAGKEIPLEIRLLPNSRTVILRTEQEGVTVLVDGRPAGTTALPEDAGISGGVAELAIENLPAGEHVYVLRKDCFREERLVDVLTIDLMESAPKSFRPISMVPASATLALDGGVEGSELFIDGEPTGRLPLEPVTVCPGERAIEIRYGGRVVWHAAVTVGESAEKALNVAARPNAALLGADVWPSALSEFGEQFSTTGGLPLAEDDDPSTAEGWAAIRLPENSDLALAVVRSSRQGAQDLWYLYSPILRSVQRLDGPPELRERPQWSVFSLGFSVADSEIGGSALVVGLDPAGPAAAAGMKVGDRIAAIEGKKVESGAGLGDLLRARSGPDGVAVEWRTAGGEILEARIQGKRSPRLLADSPGGERAITLAAWAVIDGLCGNDLAPAAMANLALLFSEYGHHELSADTWRRVHWGERPGIGEGTKQYYLAIELERLGEEEQAVSAYRRAAASEATTFDDSGPLIGPAAEDRLADLGVALNAR